jgi:hypothetical protein
MFLNGTLPKPVDYVVGIQQQVESLLEQERKKMANW